MPKISLPSSLCARSLCACVLVWLFLQGTTYEWASEHGGMIHVIVLMYSQCVIGYTITMYIKATKGRVIYIHFSLTSLLITIFLVSQ